LGLPVHKKMVLQVGLEPTRSFKQGLLKPTRLPISPLEQIVYRSDLVYITEAASSFFKVLMQARSANMHYQIWYARRDLNPRTTS
jgi:hypothetical protein